MRDWVSRLAAAGELLTVERAVDSRFELAAVTKRAQQADNRPLLFKEVAGTKLAVVTNLFSCEARLRRMVPGQEGPFAVAYARMLDAAEARVAPPVREVAPPEDLQQGKLRDLPLITYHERDAGPYFTAAIVLALDPDTGVPNLSFHRAMYAGPHELRLRLGESHDLTDYQRRAEAAGQALEVALLIGVPPGVFLAAGTHLPAGVNEYALAAELSGGPVDVYPGAQGGLPIPAAAEIVIEGRILAGERRPEGPFGEVLGYYVPEAPNHVMEVERVTWRRDALFHSLLCGSREDLAPLEAINAARVYRDLSRRLPGIVDVSCTPAFMNTTVQIRPHYEGHARDVMKVVFDSHADYNQLCCVVEEDVDLTDMNAVIHAFITRGRVDSRTMVISGRAGFYRDTEDDFAGRVGLDATRPFGREDEFVVKEVPGLDAVRLEDYLTRGNRI